MKIVNATPSDAEELLEIYSYYVENSAVTFEYTSPSVEEFRNRIITYTAKYPYLKAIDESGKALGFAFAHYFRERKAYDWAVETTIYLEKNSRHKGVGKALYIELEKRLEEMGILNMYACVAHPKKNVDDPYLTADSPNFHLKMGFEAIGIFHNCGCKFGRWYDMVWYEKIIGEHSENPTPVKFNNI